MAPGKRQDGKTVVWSASGQKPGRLQARGVSRDARLHLDRSISKEPGNHSRGNAQWPTVIVQRAVTVLRVSAEISRFTTGLLPFAILSTQQSIC
jgi:hypothetical protein